MKSSVFRSLFILYCMTIVISCHTKNTPIQDLTGLTEEVKSNYNDYSDEDWQAFAEEYQIIEQELEQYYDQYSDEEKKEIGRLKGICLAYITKYSVKNFQKNMEDAFKEVEGIVEGFSDVIKESTED